MPGVGPPVHARLCEELLDPASAAGEDERRDDHGCHGSTESGADLVMAEQSCSARVSAWENLHGRIGYRRPSDRQAEIAQERLAVDTSANVYAELRRGCQRSAHRTLVVAVEPFHTSGMSDRPLPTAEEYDDWAAQLDTVC